LRARSSATRAAGSRSCAKLRSASAACSSVSAKSKAARAEPVSALYKQGRVHHIGTFSKLEDQMCAFTSDFDRARAGYSPDRLDALVWGLTELLVEPMPQRGIFEYTRQRAEALRSQNSSPSQPDFKLCDWLEWQRQQEQAGGDRS